MLYIMHYLWPRKKGIKTSDLYLQCLHEVMRVIMEVAKAKLGSKVEGGKGLKFGLSKLC